jgi:type II secretory ATPase GspE/PulE/Tfp pilus assembly ATPase PilB-like protein
MTDKRAMDFEINVHNLGPEEVVGRLLDYAAELNVSDVFFTTNENHVSVLVRHLGIYRLMTLLNPDLGRRAMAHIKALAGLDITEHRRPQDGRWFRERAGLPKIDLRINIIPTLHGEDFALRLLVRDAHLLELANLGLLRKEYNLLLDLLNSPSGLLLVTGPTGAGKTTTLYACLNYLNNGDRKINTIEDPIEFALPGVRQAQVNPRLEVDFPDLLRSVLRQAPDVIMIGEIRDAVTADTAVRAANSGHLVLATLHAPISAGAIQSMLSLGVHPHFLGASLRGVIAQRLVRTLCPECKTTFDLSTWPTIFDDVKPWLEPGEGHLLYAPRGCKTCHKTGYANRTGVFEVLSISRELRKLIFEKQPTQSIRQQAMSEGLMEFRQSALLKVARGQTSAEEVVRVIPTEYLGLDD